VAPGKYLALASHQVFDRTPERIEWLMASRTRAKEVEVTANGTAQITLDETR
jgi:hypothetical protein